MRFWLALLSIYILSPSVFAYDTKKMDLKASEKPKELANVGITERLDHRLNTDIDLIDESGEAVKLSQYFVEGRPVIISLVYFGCANLCNFHLNGVAEALSKIPEKAGKDYEFLAISFDDKETSEIAQQKKESYLKAFVTTGAREGWHFLTGKKQDVLAIAQQVGFKYQWSEDIKEWAHASAAIMITPEKKIARYLHGVFFETKTMSLALTEASHLKISNIVNNFMLFCFKYDPKKSKYTIYAYNVMQAGAGLTVLLLALFFGGLWMKQRTTNVRSGAEKGSGGVNS